MNRTAISADLRISSLGATDRKEGSGMIILAIVILLIVVTFALQNAQLVDILFLAWSFRLNLALVVIGSLSLGVVIGAIWQWVGSIAARAQLKDTLKRLDSERNKVVTLERTIQELINKGEQPVTGNSNRTVRA